VRRYFSRKLVIYILTFILAVTIDWMIPRFMPGNPIQILISRASLKAESAALAYSFFMKSFGFDVPIWQQYLNFWNALLHGDLGVSIWLFPQPVFKIIMRAVPYDLFLLIPSIVLAWIAGNRFGAIAARSKWLDNTVSPIGYILTATPYMWLAMLYTSFRFLARSVTI
jgi:peptide/nickel transport system permease protein